MPSAEQGGLPDGEGAPQPSPGVLTLQLHKEELTVARTVRRTLVRATRITARRDVGVDEELRDELVEVERIPIGRVVDEVPPVRQEGDVTILPVVSEELVLVRRLVLKEEVHLRKVSATRRHVETVALREEQVSISRTPIEDEIAGAPSGDPLPNTPKA